MRDSLVTFTDRVGPIDFYVVALLDVLGQSRKLAPLDYLPTTQQEEDRLHEGIRSVFGPVLALRRRFADYTRDNATIVTSFLRERRIRNDAERTTCEDTGVRFMQVADAVVAFVPASDQSNRLNVGVVFSFLSACASSVVSAMEDGVAIRGAIEIGMGALFPEGDLYGPVIANVHSMESNQACYPRVLIGPKLQRNLEVLRECSNSTTAEGDHCELAKECLQLTYVDDDGLRALDYLGQVFVEAIQEKAPWSLARRKAAAFVRTERDRFQREGSEKLFERYRRLYHYFESRGLCREANGA